MLQEAVEEQFATLDYTFKANTRDHAWWDVLNLMQEADRNGLAMPRVSIAVTMSYRGGVATRTITLSGTPAFRRRRFICTACLSSARA